MIKKINKSYIGMSLLLLVAALVAMTKPFSTNLDNVGHTMLAGILITLGIWIFKPFSLSYSAGGLFLAFFSLAVGLKPTVVFSGFTQSATWTLIPALFFGYTLQSTGLGKRIALSIIKLFKPTYLSLVLAWVLIGVILSVLTPSITVRVAIAIPIAVQCCELCKLEKDSKGNSLIMLTAFGMALIPGSGWLSGALWGPIISGMINAVPQTEGLVTFGSWFNVLFVPMTLITILLLAGSILVFKPKEKLSEDAIDAIKSQPRVKMSRKEITAGIILVAVFVMFLTNKIHGIPDSALCLAAVFAFFLTGVLETKDINAGVNWDLIVFVAMALSLTAIFNEIGLSQLLSGVIVPALAPIAGNPWLFMIVILVVMFLWRFVDIAFFIPTMAILTPILPSIQDAYHISPLVWLAIFVMAANCFFMAYQNVWAMMSRSIAGDRAFESNHLTKYGIIYFAACLITLVAAIPMWISAGLFG